MSAAADAMLLQLMPQLILLVAGVAILILDLLISLQEHRGWGLGISLGGTLGAMLAVGMLWGMDQQVLYVLRYDVFTSYGWMLSLGALALLIVLSDRYLAVHSQEPGLFYALLMFCGLTVLFVVAAANLIILALALDFLSVIAYVLTGFLHEDQRSTEAAIKYLIYGAVVSALMLYGFSWLYGLTGTTDYAAISDSMRTLRALGEPATGQEPVLFPLLVLIIAGFGLKLALVPFHQWAPDAYEGAPTVVTAWLAVIPKIAGFCALVRLVTVVFPPDMVLGQTLRSPLLLAVSAAAITLGNLSGLWQERMKRLMAYSGIAQVGYFLMGVALATQFSLEASLLHLSAYVISELGIFAVIVMVSLWMDSDEIPDYNGLYEEAPLLAVALLGCLLSLLGVPGTAGFIGKFMLISAALREGVVWLAVVAGLNSVISLGYYWKVIRALFIRKPRGLRLASKPQALELKVIAAFSTFGVVLLGVWPNLVLRVLSLVASVFFTGP